MFGPHDLERKLVSKIDRSAGSPIKPELVKGTRRLSAFDYTRVSLSPGRLLDQVNRTRQVYGDISEDSILKGFRQAAGLEAPGLHMGGWCANSSAVIFGQLMSGMMRLGRALGDRNLMDKAVRLFEGWAETYAAKPGINMRPYDWEKLVCGLVDVYQYSGNTRAIALLEEVVEAADRTFTGRRPTADAFDFMGGAAEGMNEWYTLSENLYRAYLVSGNERFRDFADRWTYEDYWMKFRETSDIGTVVPVHAYSHVNTFSGAAMAYLVRGDEAYLRCCVNFYDFLQKTQCYATGGYGPDERFMDTNGAMGRSLEYYSGHAEVPCGSWAAFKLSRYLMEATGEARYGDWVETLVYNAIGAALPTEPDGKTYYYGDYRISGGIKQHYWFAWPCCSGTYIQAVADYHNQIYFHDDEGIYVNLFVPSKLQWDFRGAAVRVVQETAYPESDLIGFKIETSQPVLFKLRFRIPGWSDGAELNVNGTPVRTEAKPGEWATIEREWRAGDTVILRIPMGLRLSPIDAAHPRRSAVMWGPVVLAQDEACCRRPLQLEDIDDPATQLVRDGAELKFWILNRSPERHTRYLLPLYSFPAYWPYWVYFDLDAPPVY